MKTWQERLWSKVARPFNGCWEWPGCKTEFGHGLMGRAYKVERTHRLSWEDVNGPIPEGLVICHKCDNPACIRPDHLFIGTHAINSADMRAKNRGVNPPALPGAQNPAAKLTGRQVSAIKRSNGPQRIIASKYGISKSQVGRIKQGLSWASV
jgi:hypothetical protein